MFHQTDFLQTDCSASASDPFAERHGLPLPRELAAETLGMSWSDFSATYASGGAIRLGAWSSRTTRGDLVEYQATIAYGDRIIASRATASGPIAGLTAMLYDLGIGIEVRSLHRRDTSEGIAAFLHCHANDSNRWSMGMAEEAETAYISALIAAANRLV